MFSKILVGKSEAIALAPLAVRIDRQREGVGKLLIMAGHSLARKMGYSCSVVLGDSNYYSRFGYETAANYGIVAPFDVPEEYYMVCNLSKNGDIPNGYVKYSDAFGSRIVRCNEDDYEALVGIWERSVRVTHSFLKEKDFNEIKVALIPDYFPNVDLYAIADNGVYVGFIGLSLDSIEMLFIDSERRGQGYGSSLIEFAKQRGATKVDVNEQNTSALNFYKAKGFHVVARDEKDEAGRSYPILHLCL